MRTALLCCLLAIATAAYPPAYYINTQTFSNSACSGTPTREWLRAPGCYAYGEQVATYSADLQNEIIQPYTGGCNKNVYGSPQRVALNVCSPAGSLGYQRIIVNTTLPTAGSNDAVQVLLQLNGCDKNGLGDIFITHNTQCDRTAAPKCDDPKTYSASTLTLCGDAFNYYFGTTNGPVENNDRAGYDLPGMPITTANSQACQSQCFARPDCATWASDSCGTNCWLKSNPDIPTNPNSCRQSGVISRYYGPVSTGIDAPLNDLPGMPITTTSVQDCQANCFYNSACVSWAADTCGTNCWLKGTSISNTVSNSCRASGNIFRTRY